MFVRTAALAFMVGLGSSANAHADEAFAKSRMKAMSDYVTGAKDHLVRL